MKRKKKPFKSPQDWQTIGNSLAVQWLGLHTTLPRVWVGSSGWGTKILHAICYE